jgi:hypothetical protein
MVARYLIVGGETAANPEVVQEAESILARDKDATFTLLVPATHVRQYLGQHKGEDEEVARRMAEAAVRRFQGADIPLDYRIGPPDPLQAVDEEFKERNYDEVLVSTYSPRRSRWLAMKVPDKVEDKYKIPVRHVEASPDFLQHLEEFGPYG